MQSRLERMRWTFRLFGFGAAGLSRRTLSVDDSNPTIDLQGKRRAGTLQYNCGLNVDVLFIPDLCSRHAQRSRQSHLWTTFAQPEPILFGKEVDCIADLGQIEEAHEMPVLRLNQRAHQERSRSHENPPRTVSRQEANRPNHVRSTE